MDSLQRAKDWMTATFGMMPVEKTDSLAKLIESVWREGVTKGAKMSVVAIQAVMIELEEEIKVVEKLNGGL